MRAMPAVQIVQMPPPFSKSPYGFFRSPNNRKNPVHLHYLHSSGPVFAMFNGVRL